METEKKLYPMKFVPLRDEYSWGTEEFLIADLGYRDSFVLEGWLASNTVSEVVDTYLDRVVGESVFDYYGKQFPVYIKRICVKGKMPLRVSPGDELASERYDSLGKEKIWYVTGCGKNAGLMLGFKEGCNASDFYNACTEGNVERYMNIVAPHAGQVIRIAPGTVHAAFGDMEIIEISEASALDFLLYAWGQEIGDEEFDPSLGLVEAMDFIDYNSFKSEVPSRRKDKTGFIETLTGKGHFQVDRINLKTTLKSGLGEFDSFILYTCISGKAAIEVELSGQCFSYSLCPNELILVCPECQNIILAPEENGTIILQTTIPELEKSDPYINPDAESTLPDEN